MGSERSGMIKRCEAEELLKIGQRPWLKLRTTVLDLTEELEQKVNYICCLVSSTVYLYGEPKTSTVWASIDLKQRQLFDLD